MTETGGCCVAENRQGITVVLCDRDRRTRRGITVVVCVVGGVCVVIGLKVFLITCGGSRSVTSCVGYFEFVESPMRRKSAGGQNVAHC